MFAYNHNARPRHQAHGSVVSVIAAAILCWVAFAAPAVAVDAGDITVSSLKGEVHVTLNGAARKVRAGSVLELPATVRTGRDGAIELRQGATSLSVGPETLLEFPALEKPGAPIDRVVQPRGNVFYDIGKREGRKLRVETPYLVGVVKGTQFNVAAQEESTTISLFEGLLEIRATDESALVDLKAGEIASRRRGEKNISVIKMDAGNTPTPGARPRTSDSNNHSHAGDAAVAASPRPAGDAHEVTLPDSHGASLLDTSSPRSDGAAVALAVDVRTPVTSLGVDTTVDAGAGNVTVNAGTNISVGAPVDAGVNTGVTLDAGGVDVNANAGVNLGAGAVDVNANAGVSLDTGGVDVNASTSVNVGSVVDAGAGVSVDLGGNAASVDVSTNLGVDAGVASAGASTNVSLDVTPTNVSVDTGIGAQIDAGPASVDVSTSAGVDLATSGVAVDAGLSTAVDTGPISAGVDVGAAVDLGADSIGASVDAGAALGAAAPVIDAGLNTTVDVSTGTVDLGVSLGGLDVNVGLDLGLGGNDDATDTDSSTTDTATDTGDTGTVDVGGLLDGLLRRPGRQ